MKKLLKEVKASFFLALLLVVGTFGYARAEESDAAADRRIVQNIVSIDIERDRAESLFGRPLPRRGTGSGVIAGPYTIITAAHVIWKARAFTVKTASGEKVAIRDAVIIEAFDIAILWTERPLKSYLSIRPSPPVIGEEIIAAGYLDKNSPITITRGGISTTHWESDGMAMRTLFTTALGGSGMSGGALTDKDGNLVGIIIRRYEIAPVEREYIIAVPLADFCKQYPVCRDRDGTIIF